MKAALTDELELQPDDVTIVAYGNELNVVCSFFNLFKGTLITFPK